MVFDCRCVGLAASVSRPGRRQPDHRDRTQACSASASATDSDHDECDTEPTPRLARSSATAARHDLDQLGDDDRPPVSTFSVGSPMYWQLFVAIIFGRFAAISLFVIPAAYLSLTPRKATDRGTA